MPIPNPDDEDRSSAVIPLAAVLGLLLAQFIVIGGLLVVAAMCKFGGG